MPTQVKELSTSRFTGALKEGLEDGFERVVEISDSAAGLRAYVALHSTALGPALGGTRMFAYDSQSAAVADVCNLARGMSYKNALADIPFGGGKAVIVGDPRRKTEAQLCAFAEGLNALGGAYLSAEDSGISPADMAVVGRHSAYVAGADKAPATTIAGEPAAAVSHGGGNPAPFTARGVFLGLKTAVRAKLGRQSLDGLSVGIEGLGQVGYALARMLREAGAEVYASELNEERLTQAQAELGVHPRTATTLLAAPIQVFAPCAMGGAINTERLNQMTAPVIAGAANNQLENPALGDVLAQRGQLYAPDYVINAAGVISIAGEYMGCWTPEWVNAKVAQIPQRLEAIFDRASCAGVSTALVADRCAREVIRNAGRSLLSKSA